MTLPSDFCVNCKHLYQHHGHNHSCMVAFCDCKEFIDMDDIDDDLDNDDLDEDNIDKEDKDEIKLILKTLFFFSDHINKNAVRIDCLNDSLNKYPELRELYEEPTAINEVANSIKYDVKCLERAATLLLAYLNIDIPPIDDINKEFEERREFEKLLQL